MSPVLPEGGLLAVHAHPDDETLATGALLATWAAAGRPVTVVTCTRGERGEVIDTATHPTGLRALEGDRPALAAHRERELAGALAALGVQEHHFLDAVDSSSGIPVDTSTVFEDSGMAWVAPGIAGPAADSGTRAFARVPLDEAASRLAALVRRRRPAVVVTYEAGGGYGHPDHVRAHEVTVRALAMAADLGASIDGVPAAPALWEVVAPSSRLRAARRALAGSAQVGELLAAGGLTLEDPAAELPPVGVDDGALGDVATVEVRPVLDRVLAALRAHATQVQQVRALDLPGVVAVFALSNGVLAPVLDTAFHRRCPPTPVGSAR